MYQHDDLEEPGTSGIGMNAKTPKAKRRKTCAGKQDSESDSNTDDDIQLQSDSDSLECMSWTEEELHHGSPDNNLMQDGVMELNSYVVISYDEELWPGKAT